MSSLNPHFGVLARNAAVTAVVARMNNATMKFYDGTQPADCSVAVSTQTLGVTITFGSTAFGAASAGSAALSGTPLTATISASLTPCTWFRIVNSDGTTVEHDGSVGTATANCIVDAANFSAGATLSLNSGSVSHAA